MMTLERRQKNLKYSQGKSDCGYLQLSCNHRLKNCKKKKKRKKEKKLKLVRVTER